MEHIVQFAISIDDNAIKKTVEEKAEREIITQLKTEVACEIFGSIYRHRGSTDPSKIFTPLVKEIINEFLNENKDVILENTSKMLAHKLVHSKKGKEILDNLEV